MELGVTMVKKDKLHKQGVIEKGLSLAVTPVNPQYFTSKVQAFLQSQGVQVSKDTHEVIDKLCKLLNYSIDNPKLGGLLNRKNILIYPAETGIGKSVSLQHYAAMLTHESSLIIVNTIEEARDYCKNVNGIKQNRSYAKFFASVNTADDNQLAITKHSPQQVQCLILTNKMFKTLHTRSKYDIEQFRLYRPNINTELRTRDLVVVDERLSFMSKKVVKFEELKGIHNFLAQTLVTSPTMKNNTDIKAHLGSVKAIIDAIEEAHSEKTASLVDKLSIEDKLERAGLPILVDFEAIANVISARLDELDAEVSLLKPSKISNLDYIKEAVIKLINAFIVITQPRLSDKDETHTGGEEIYSEFAIYKKDMYQVSSLFNKFGTAVVLDATAEVNDFYIQSSNTNSNLDIVSAPKIRKYENLTIYKARNQPQSANAVYKKDKQTAKKSARWYSAVINEILEEGDKLLVISFKDFIETYLEPHFVSDKRVQFTNWGKHVGRNNWSDCNKVIIIGWLRLGEADVVAKLFHTASLGSKDIRTLKHVTPERIKELQFTEIADDLAQGAMRCRARVMDTADSDCKPASVYFFEDALDGSDKVAELFESQFPCHKLVHWVPKTLRPSSVLSKPDQKKELAINYLQELSKNHHSYARSAYCKEIELAPSTLTRWLSKGYFKGRFAELGYRIEKPKGKPERIVFK